MKEPMNPTYELELIYSGCIARNLNYYVEQYSFQVVVLPQKFDLYKVVHVLEVQRF